MSTGIPTFDLLGTLGTFLIEIFERILAQLILQLIIYLLQQLIAQLSGANCADLGLGSSNPTIDSAALKNYGAEDLNKALKDSIGVYDDDVYNSRIKLIYTNCAKSIVYLSNEEEFKVPDNLEQYFEDVSKMISPIEMLSLFDGTSPQYLLSEILEFTQSEYPSIGDYFNTNEKIRSLYACMGENISTLVVDRIENDIADLYKNPEL